MNEIENLEKILDNNQRIIIINDGSYNKIIIAYSENVLFTLLDSVKFATNYSGKLEGPASNPLDIRIVNSSVYKAQLDSLKTTGEV